MQIKSRWFMAVKCCFIRALTDAEETLCDDDEKYAT